MNFLKNRAVSIEAEWRPIRISFSGYTQTGPSAAGRVDGLYTCLPGARWAPEEPTHLATRAILLISSEWTLIR